MINFSTRPPSVSVVMPVYNGGQYLAEAIQSILYQAFPDFELIIIDDGSTDHTPELIASFHDRRIVSLTNTRNMGNYASRNRGMEIARGKYICVMDADDVALPLRLEKQYAFMEQNPGTGICGSFIQNIPSGFCPEFIVDEQLLKVAFLSNNFCSHPSLILRKEFLHRFKLQYNEAYRYAADFDLCARGFKHFRVQNIPGVLLQYRRHAGQISTAKFAEQQKYADDIRIRQLTENLGFETGRIPTLLHLQLMKKEPIAMELKPQAQRWIETIIEKNASCHYYHEKQLTGFLHALSDICFGIRKPF